MPFISHGRSVPRSINSVEETIEPYREWPLPDFPDRGAAVGGEEQELGAADKVGGGQDGKLEVSFFGPFWGDYWVLERADDYSWSIVGEPEGRYLWILTRARTITADERTLLEARVRSLGYDTSKLVWNGG